jgi:hypothetical protein
LADPSLAHLFGSIGGLALDAFQPWIYLLENNPPSEGRGAGKNISQCHLGQKYEKGKINGGNAWQKKERGNKKEELGKKKEKGERKRENKSKRVKEVQNREE